MTGQPRLADSRRLTGPNLLTDRPAAVIDVAIGSEDAQRIEEVWRHQVRELLNALALDDCRLAVRHNPGGVSLAFTAPIDMLYAATQINEQAWTLTTSILRGEAPTPVGDVAGPLSAAMAAERNPALLALRDAALDHGVTFLSDDDHASIGLGVGSQSWPVSRLPDPASIDWARVGKIPLVLVTGTNGKTTTVRLLASIAKAAGKVAGFSSTDGIWIGGALSERGDYSGPGGARQVLRDQRVEIALLETARGGLLRRGVAVTDADVAVVTNVSEDHIGDFGVHDLESLRETKFLVTRVVGVAGRVVLNADDPLVMGGREDVSAPIVLTSLEPEQPRTQAWLAEGGALAHLDGRDLVYSRGREQQQVIAIDEIPITFAGAARHNIANALSAIAAAHSIGFSNAQIADGLRAFAGTPEELPGRSNMFRLGEVEVLVDFAHNAEGHRALIDTVKRLGRKRWGILLGHAGDRDDASICELSRITAEARPDSIFIKEMEVHLRGRTVGEIPDIIEAELRRLGVAFEGRYPNELAAVRAALQWARPGDLLALPLHAARDEILEFLARLEASSWKPGEPVPS